MHKTVLRFKRAFAFILLLCPSLQTHANYEVFSINAHSPVLKLWFSIGLDAAFVESQWGKFGLGTPIETQGRAPWFDSFRLWHATL